MHEITIHNISLSWLSRALRVPPGSPEHMMPHPYVTIRLQRTQARARQFLNMFLQIHPLDRKIFKGFILDSDVAFGKQDPREARLPSKALSWLYLGSIVVSFWAPRRF